MGCAAKVPQPEFKSEIEQYYNWAKDSKKHFEKHGLEVGAKKMKLAMKRAQLEIREIESMEEYIKDEAYEPKIQF
ncbi:hypothetical protein D3C74_410830 [compost metagenome]